MGVRGKTRKCSALTEGPKVLREGGQGAWR
jgi:hypothetical protein